MILIDSGPLVALCDPRDEYHKRSRAEWVGIQREPFTLPTSVLAEALYHLPRPDRRRFLRELIAHYEMLPPVIDDEQDFRRLVFDWLECYAEHRPDFADGCLAVLSSMDRRYRVWTFDREFETIWRRPDGTKIPLVGTRK